MFDFDFIIYSLVWLVIFPSIYILGLILLNIIRTKFNNFRNKLLYFIYLSLLFALRVFFWMYVYLVVEHILNNFDQAC
jgi:hypothetical protein